MAVRIGAVLHGLREWFGAWRLILQIRPLFMPRPRRVVYLRALILETAGRSPDWTRSRFTESLLTFRRATPCMPRPRMVPSRAWTGQETGSQFAKVSIV